MGPLVSVVVPVYNVEEYLDRCVQSITNQTYQNLEIILVDDGSTDASSAICDSWAKKDNRIKVIHKKNEGLGMARNTGLDNLAGEYICFFDSDDYIDLTTVEKCVTAMQKDNSEVVVFGCINDYGDRKIKQSLNVKRRLFEGDSVQGELISSLLTYGMGFGVSCCMKMFRTEAINDNSIRFKSERDVISEDAIFILELFSKIKAVSIIPENLYIYYKNGDSLTNRYRADRQAKNDDFLQIALKTANDVGLPENVCKYITARYHMYVISAMKQLLLSDLPKKEKRVRLNEMLNGSVLRSSLNFDTIKIHTKTLRLFFTFLKFRCHLLCKALLYLKIKLS